MTYSASVRLMHPRRQVLYSRMHKSSTPATGRSQNLGKMAPINSNQHRSPAGVYKKSPVLHLLSATLAKPPKKPPSLSRLQIGPQQTIPNRASWRAPLRVAEFIQPSSMSRSLVATVRKQS